MVIAETENGQKVIVISQRNRVWWVESIKTGKSFRINKNKLICIEKSENLSDVKGLVNKTKKKDQ